MQTTLKKKKNNVTQHMKQPLPLPLPEKWNRLTKHIGSQTGASPLLTTFPPTKIIFRVPEMVSKQSASLALFLSLNLVFFALTSACGTCPSPKPKPKPNPTPSPTPAAKGTCPRDALKLGVCANILGINLNIPLSLSLVLNNCGKKFPTGFQCA
uniref:14 kDa proline-rich protein DC2.15-like n=1 Tax=Nelumbo nucifera TaxID=4432 RepID=A0A822XHE4_NELNU|nr:TPA_asm: hypothetical protein HUJ06_020015 [Nelumbo nucifera]